MWSSNSADAPASQKPYLLRAMYQWLEDSEFTPHLAIAYPAQGWVTGVPEALLKDEILILNISSLATRNLEIGTQYIDFDTRFSGQSHQVSVDLRAVIGLFGRENSHGIRFALPEDFAQQSPQNNKPKRKFQTVD